MLNEWIELEAYVRNPESDLPRIQPKFLTESFGEELRLNGIEQILTTIARAFIFQDQIKKIYTADGYLDEALLTNTVELLRRWCGFSGEVDTDVSDSMLLSEWYKRYPAADGWLKKYWYYQISKLKKKTAEEIDALWEALEKKWSVSLSSTYDYQAKSISYHNIIANALAMGELRNRYLVFRKDTVQSKVKEKDKFNYLYESEGSPQATTKMKLLKNIAAYLIFLEHQPKGQKEILLKRGNLLGWYGLDDEKNDTKKWSLENLLWHNEPIFQRINTGASFIKIKIASGYIEHFDFHIIEECEMGKYKNKSEYWMLEDRGHGLKECWITI